MVEREEGGFSSATPRRLAAAFSRRTVILNDETGMVRTIGMPKMVGASDSFCGRYSLALVKAWQGGCSLLEVERMGLGRGIPDWYLVLPGPTERFRGTHDL